MDLVRSRPRAAIDVLVVDSDRDTTDTLADVLSSSGFKVAVADSEVEARAFLKRNPTPRMILSGIDFLDHWEETEVTLLASIQAALPLPGFTDQILNRPADLYRLLSLVHLKVSKK